MTTPVDELLGQVEAASCTAGREEEALRLCEQVMKMAEKEFGTDHPKTASVLEVYGKILWQLKRLDEAERVVRRAVNIYERAYGSDHIRVASTLLELSHVYAFQGRLTEAKILFRHTLAVVYDELNANSPGALIELLGRLSALCEVTGETEAIKGLEAEIEAIRSRN